MKTQRLDLGREWVLRGADGRDVCFSLGLGETLTVGRDLSADVTLLDAGVSRYHASLFLDGDELWIEDLHSQNGTFVNSMRIQRARLQPGDIITFGRIHLSLLAPEPPESPASLAALEGLPPADLVRLLEIFHDLLRAEPEGVHQLALDGAASALRADRGAMLYWERDRHLLRPAAAHPHEGFHDLEEFVDGPFAEAVFLGGRAQSLSRGEGRSPAVAGTGHVVAAPLRRQGGGGLGVVYLERSAPPFRRSEVEFLSAFSWLASAVLERVAARECAGGEAPRGVARAGVRPDLESWSSFAPPSESLSAWLVDLESRLDRVRARVEELVAADSPLRQELLPELSFLKICSESMRSLWLAGRPRPEGVDLARSVRAALEASSIPVDSWSLEPPGPFPAYVPLGILDQAVRLIVEALASCMDLSRGVKVELRALSRRPQAAAVQAVVRFSFRYSRARGGGGAPFKPLLSLARRLTETLLLGHLRVDLPEGIVELEFPAGLISLEETLKF